MSTQTVEQRLAALALTSLPMWVMDSEHGRMRWANDAAVRLFNAKSVAELLARDFSDFSEASRARMARHHAEFQAGRDVWDTWTLYPKGKPTPVRLHVSAFTLDDGRLASLCEAYLLDHGPESSQLRGIEALRHTAAMVALLTPTGEVLMENPAASRAFLGSLLADWFVEPAVVATVLAVPAQQEPYRAEAHVRTTAGLRWHLVDARRTLDPVTGAPAILLEQIDITSLHDAQNLIEQQHRQILELQHAAQLTIERQHEEISLLSAPIIAVGPQIAVLPIVGTCDVNRLEQIQESVLSTVATQRLKDVILDLTGALGLSLSSARKLALLVKALRLLGATPILTGIQPALARLLIEAEGFPTETLVFRDLRHALATLTAAKLPKDSVREEDSLSGEAALPIFKPPTKL